jgi:hypothetical protein
MAHYNQFTKTNYNLVQVALNAELHWNVCYKYKPKEKALSFTNK